MKRDLFSSTAALMQKVDLPSQPELLIQVNREINRENPSFSRVAEIVSRDQDMAARIVKVASSPFFGRRDQVKSITQALAVLGIINFRNIVLTSCLREAMHNGDVTEQESEMFWEHSLLVASIAQFIARRVNLPTTLLYMAGLFHDSAMMVFAGNLPGYLKGLETGVADWKKLLEYEETNISTNHCLAGYFLAQAWDLPELVGECIRHHHETDVRLIKDPALRKMVGTMVLTESIIHRQRSEDDAPDILGLDVKDPEKLARILFDLDIPGEDFRELSDEIMELMDQL